MIIPKANYITDNQAQRTLVQLNLADWENVITELRTFAICLQKCYALAQESWAGMITEGKSYLIILHQDEEFPQGEECVIGDNGELITLFFKHQITIRNGHHIQG